MQLRGQQLYVEKNKIDFFTECSQMPWVIQLQSICAFSVFLNAHSQSIYHKFDFYMHFHDVLSVVSDLPQFSLSTFKLQLLDRQQNDYISNAKKENLYWAWKFWNYFGQQGVCSTDVAEINCYAQQYKRYKGIILLTSQRLNKCKPSMEDKIYHSSF